MAQGPARRVAALGAAVVPYVGLLQSRRASSKPFIASPVACEGQKPSYYSSYTGDKFGGRIGTRLGLDESQKRRLPGTGVDRVALISAPHGSLKAWATEANWKEATRIHKGAYFSRKENLVQEAVLQRIRQHYTASPECLNDVLIQAALFRMEDEAEFSRLCTSTHFSRIPSVVRGVFDEKNERCVVDFANKRLGGAWLGYGMVQEEKMFIERFDYGALCAKSLVDLPEDPTDKASTAASPFSMHENEAWILRGGRQFAELGWYGRTPKDAMGKWKPLSPLDDAETCPTIVAIDAIKANFKTYTKEHLEMMLKKAFIGFVAAGKDEDVGGQKLIATGSWGCGAFCNNEGVMFVVQALAANLAGVDLTHHVLGDGRRLDGAWQMLEDALLRGLTVAEVLAELAQRCANDAEWATKYKPQA